MHRYFVLEGRQAVGATQERWRGWFFQADREVARTRLPDGAQVATEFVGADQRAGSGRPLLFETRTFDPDRNIVGQRLYATWTQAARGHQKEVRRRFRSHDS